MYLLIQVVLPFQYGIIVVSLIRSVPGSDKPNLHIVMDDLFQRLAVLFIHSQHKKGEHDQHHTERGRAGTGIPFQQEKERYAHQTAAAEAYKLAGSQVEHHFCL